MNMRLTWRKISQIFVIVVDFEFIHINEKLKRLLLNDKLTFLTIGGLTKGSFGSSQMKAIVLRNIEFSKVNDGLKLNFIKDNYRSKFC